jgi:hypothetical protein
LRGNEISNLFRNIDQFGRKVSRITIIDGNEIKDGEYVDLQTISIVRGGLVEIHDASFQRVLDCGHIGSASSIAALCSCGNLVCEACSSVCAHCNLLFCRSCSKVYEDEEGHEMVLCNSCYSAEKRKRAALKAGRTVLNFFVKREED